MLRESLTTTAFVLAASAAGAQDDPTGPIFITNVNVFDGRNEDLIENANAVIDGNPLEVPSLGANSWDNFDPIMQDGVSYEQEL